MKLHPMLLEHTHLGLGTLVGGVLHHRDPSVVSDIFVSR